MYPTMMIIAADQIMDMRADAARDLRARLVRRRARLSARHAAAAQHAGHQTTGARAAGRELSERHA